MINTNSTKEEVLEAVKKNGFSLKYASEELKGDKEVVLAAVQKNGFAFKYASEVAKQNPLMLVHAIKELRNMRENIMAALGGEICQ
jgi:predicted methyltransferase